MVFPLDRQGPSGPVLPIPPPPISTVFGDDYQFVEVAGPFVTGSGAPLLVPGSTLITPALTGIYRLGMSAAGGSSTAVLNAQAFNVTDGVIEIFRRVIGVAGILEVGVNGFKDNIIFTGASKTFEVQIFKNAGPGTVKIGGPLLSGEELRLEFWRVS